MDHSEFASHVNTIRQRLPDLIEALDDVGAALKAMQKNLSSDMDALARAERLPAFAPEYAQKELKSVPSAERTLEEMSRAKLRSNDILEISGEFAARKRGEPSRLRVNGGTAIKLSRRELLLLLVLAKHRVGASVQECAGFLPVNEIVNRVEQHLYAWEERTGAPQAIWKTPCEGDIHRLVYELRAKLVRIVGTDMLLETGPEQGGYRLSVPRQNILLSEQLEAWWIELDAGGNPGANSGF